MLTVIEERGDGLQQLIADAQAKKATDGGMAAAAAAFADALAVIDRTPGGDDAGGRGEDRSGQSDRDYVVQQLALTTYKAKEPSEPAALERGLEIIAQLSPATSNDTETLGIAGAMEKRLWGLTGERSHLDRAIEYYGRGFEVKRDYYNGENYATCLVMRAAVQDDDEAAYDRMTAKKTREKIVEELERVFASGDLDERADAVWMRATMANCLFALDRETEALEHEAEFERLAGDVSWMLDNYEDGKASVLAEPSS